MTTPTTAPIGSNAADDSTNLNGSSNLLRIGASPCEPLNKRFLSAVFGSPDAVGRIAYCSFEVSPEQATGQHWLAELAPQGKIPVLSATSNNYFSTAVVRDKRNIENFIRLAVLVLDDIKVDTMPPLAPSYRLETSAGNFQLGYIIADSPHSRDIGYVERAIRALIAANLMADKSGNNAVRWVRMIGVNSKEANIDSNGRPFQCVLHDMERSRRYSIEEVIAAYGVRVGAAPARSNGNGTHAPDLESQIQTLTTAAPGMHDAQVSLGMKLIVAGTNPEFAKKILRALTCNDGTERTEGRLADVDRTIDSAVRKINADANQPSEPRRFKLLTVDDLLAQPHPTWWIKGVLPRAALIVVYGEAGSGKSAFAYDMAWSLANGTKWCDRVVQQCRVLWTAAEGAGGHRNRTEALDKVHRIDRAQLLTLLDAPNLLDEEQVKELAKEIDASGGVGLIAVDTVAQTTPGANENSSEHMGKLIAHCRMLHELTGATIMLIHHAGKDASKGARGWSGLRAAVDAEIEITRNGDDRVARISKMKDGDDNARFPFKLLRKVLRLDDDGDEITSIVVEHVPLSTVAHSAPKPRGETEAVIYDAMMLLQPTDGTRRIDRTQVIEAVLSKIVLNPKKPTTRERPRQNVERALRSMEKRGVIHMDDECAWLA
jgi:hypothetical protein